MAVRRIKDRWHNSTPEVPDREVLDEKTLDDQAGALAFITWRHALNGAINLHAEDYRYDDDHQRIAVISELLAFQVQLIDRLSHSFLQTSEREIFINALCSKVADHMQDNLEDIAGPGNYRPPFVALLNDRFTEYATFAYSDERPGYDTLRCLGHKILQIMGDDQTNRWVIDQIIEIDAPELIDNVIRSTSRLFGREAEQEQKT